MQYLFAACLPVRPAFVLFVWFCALRVVVSCLVSVVIQLLCNFVISHTWTLSVVIPSNKRWSWTTGSYSDWLRENLYRRHLYLGSSWVATKRQFFYWPFNLLIIIISVKMNSFNSRIFLLICICHCPVI